MKNERLVERNVVLARPDQPLTVYQPPGITSGNNAECPDSCALCKCRIKLAVIFIASMAFWRDRQCLELVPYRFSSAYPHLRSPQLTGDFRPNPMPSRIELPGFRLHSQHFDRFTITIDRPAFTQSGYQELKRPRIQTQLNRQDADCIHL